MFVKGAPLHSATEASFLAPIFAKSLQMQTVYYNVTDTDVLFIFNITFPQYIAKFCRLACHACHTFGTLFVSALLPGWC